MALQKSKASILNFIKAGWVLFLFVTVTPSAWSASDRALTLWYTQPAKEWVEALPVGNGRLGAMVFGGVTDERIQFNESTLWVGEPHDYSNSGAAAHLGEIRKLLFDGKQKEAEELALREFMSLPLRQMPYQPFADLRLHFEGEDSVTDYRRELNLDEAVVRTLYQARGVKFVRETFSSEPDQVLVTRIKAVKKGALSFSVGFDCPHTNSAVTAGGKSELVLTGRARDWYDGRKIEHPTKFEARLLVRTDGGEVTVEDGRIQVKGANAAELLLVAATSFKNFEDVSGDPSKACLKALNAVRKRSWEKLLAAHQEDHRELFRRVTLDLGGDENSNVPTDERLKRAPKGNDPGLVTLVFQYGRYLMIACSRPGGQPATLQGLWNESLKPPWDSKYTCNINTEMNYWPVEVANLAECHLPLFDALEDLSESGARVAKNHYNAHGWVVHHNFDIWRGAAPINAANHGIWVSGAAWMCQHLWWHYEFGGDRVFLKQAYPLMKGAALFFADFLIEDPRNTNHWLISTPSNSPEQGGLVAGPTMDHQIIRDVFANVIEASRVLGVDAELREKLTAMRARIAPNQIGQHGQLQEWLEDKDEIDNKHRHVSHLWGVFPGHDITWQNTNFFNAARQSLIYRGDEATGWSMGWKINLWARFLDGDHAHLILRNLLRPIHSPEARGGGGLYPNLFDAHAPFQIDGNFGATAGIAEMLLQSHIRDAKGNYVLQLLPSLPSAWPTGSVTGLRARGGFEVDLTWRDGKLTKASVRSVKGDAGTLMYGTKTKEIKAQKGTMQWGGE